MPRKKNRRKEIQAKKHQASQQKKRRGIAIDPVHSLGTTSTMAALAAIMFRRHKKTPDA